jgi:subtilisin family serine protease
MLDRRPGKIRKSLTLLASVALMFSFVGESFAQGRFGGFSGGRMMGGGNSMGMGRPMGDGIRPGGLGNRYPGGDGPRYPGGWRRPGVLIVPGGGPIGPGPGTVVVIEDDGPAPRRGKKPKPSNKQAKKQIPPRQQLAQRGGFNVPPAGENRFVPDEVLLNVPASLTLPALDQIARRNRLTRLELRDFTMTRRRLARLRINDGRPVANVIRSLQADARILGAQPNYLYALEQGGAAAADPTQYALGKMRLPEAHAIAKGATVRVAVIDTLIDASHPDLAGTVAASFDATGMRDKPHMHGTAIAGVIAAHGKLTGAAPAVAILGVTAFSAKSSRGSSMDVLKGLEWAATSKANVVNMSFAGPSDSELQLMIEAVRRSGIILIAAAGNAGPKSRPLYPAAYPDVIAVTATDIDDGLFEHANRGTHIAVEAPGVAILVAAPNEGYQMQSGTSFAAAQVSGVAALLLERNNKLDLEAIRRILTATARDLGAPGPDDRFGAGLVDALGAVEQAAPKESDVSGASAARSK